MNRRRLIRTVIVLLSFAFAAACAKKMSKDEMAPSSSIQSPSEEEEARTDRDKDGLADGEVAPIGVEDLVRTNNLFAWDLYRSLRADDIAISPHATASAVAIMHAGASGPTAAELAKTLRIELEEGALQDRFAQLHGVLRSRATSGDRTQPRGFRLLVSHGVWLDDRFTPSPAFLNVATNDHFATVEALDFDKADVVAQRIAALHRDASGGRIEGLAVKPTGAGALFTTSTHFDGPWALPFQRAVTRTQTFDAPSGARNVSMMRGRVRVGYLEGEGYQLLELPYADGVVSAWFLLPSADNADIDGTITADFFDWMMQSARQSEVDVELPRFEIASRQSLGATLRSMGAALAFDAKNAELGALATSDEAPLYVADVVQVTRVKVDEDGSDAMAPTRTPITAPGGSSDLPRFAASRPFLVIVRDNPTGAILAMARVANP